MEIAIPPNCPLLTGVVGNTFLKTCSRGFGDLTWYPSWRGWRWKSRGAKFWAQNASPILLIALEIRPPATVRFTIRCFKTLSLPPYFFASTSPKFCPSGVDSFAPAALFCCREGVLLKTAETAVFAESLKIGCFLAGGPLLQSTAKHSILNRLT